MGGASSIIWYKTDVALLNIWCYIIPSQPNGLLGQILSALISSALPGSQSGFSYHLFSDSLNWRCWALNPQPSANQAGAPQLSHIFSSNSPATSPATGLPPEAWHSWGWWDDTITHKCFLALHTNLDTRGWVQPSLCSCAGYRVKPMRTTGKQWLLLPKQCDLVSGMFFPLKWGLSRTPHRERM